MSRNNHFYSQKNHSVTIAAANGTTRHTITDFAEGASISWEYNSTDNVSLQTGFDGSRLSLACDKSGKITIQLKPTSPSVGWLTRLYRLQLDGTPILLNVTISTGVQEIHRLVNALVMKGGGETGDKTMGTREFSFLGEELIEDDSE